MRKLDKKGFTLIEVIVSCAVLALVGSVILGCFVVGNKMIADSTEIERANQEIQAYIDGVKADDPSLIATHYENANFVIDFEGSVIEVKGRIVIVYNTSGSIVKYKIFST